MTEAGTRIEKSEVFLPEGPLKQTGDFEADVILHPEVRFAVKVHVAGEEGEAPDGYIDDTPPEPVPAPAEETLRRMLKQRQKPSLRHVLWQILTRSVLRGAFFLACQKNRNGVLTSIFCRIFRDRCRDDQSSL